METYQVLEKALALIEDEKDWVPYMGAPSLHGPHCSVTATLRVQYPPRGVRWSESPWGKALRQIAGGNVANFNDNHTHAEVVALFKEAIRAEKAKAGIPVELPAVEPIAEVTA